MTETPANKKRKTLRTIVLGISGRIGSGKSTLSEAVKTQLGKDGWIVFERNFADQLKELVAFHFGIELERCYTQDGKNSTLPKRLVADNIDKLVAFHFGIEPATLDVETLLPERYGDGMTVGKMIKRFREHLRPIDLELATVEATTVGRMLQLFGTCLRGVHENLWINSVADFIEQKSGASNSGKGIVFIVPDCRFPNEAQWVSKEMRGKVVRLNGDPGAVAKNSKRDLAHISETALDTYAHFDLVIDTDKTSVEASVAQVMAMLME
jgi:ABC-type dipeptide/oligopeptide/nickel transport system ATPase subunit